MPKYISTWRLLIASYQQMRTIASFFSKLEKKVPRKIVINWWPDTKFPFMKQKVIIFRVSFELYHEVLGLTLNQNSYDRARAVCYILTDGTVRGGLPCYQP